MKRCLAKLVVFLFLGAIVNVAVAWSCALWSDLRPPTPIAADAIDRIWQKHVTFRGDAADFAASFSKGFGYTVLWAQTRSREKTKIDALHLFQAGWPVKCLVAEAGRNSGLDKEIEYITGWNAPAGIGPIPVDLGNPRLIPLHPIWPGFAINTVFYAAILWTLTLGLFTLRRMIRHKRGHCIKCGYDLRGAEHEVCPECGLGREVVEAIRRN